LIKRNHFHTREDIMVKWNYFAAILLALAVPALSCSGSGGNPVTATSDEDMPRVPGLTAASTQDVEPANSVLWGCYDVAFDMDSHKVDVSLNRTAMFTLNAVTFLNNNPAGVSFSFNGVNTGADFIEVDVDITITHPLGDERFNGYDVRGIFIGNGSGDMEYGENLRYPVEGFDQMLVNADGYTRWFNPIEFGTPGIGGYTPGRYASPGYFASSTLNPYKYFGDGLSATGDLWTYLVAGAENTGYFLAGTSNVRNYILRFPLPVPAVKYSYAVVADWECPDCHPSHCAESVGVLITDNSTLWHVDEEKNGGMLDLDISVFNWYAELTGDVMRDYSIFIESDVLNFPHEFATDEMTPVGGGDNYSTYHVEIPVDAVQDEESADVWVIIEDSLMDYSSPFGIPNEAENESLAAFFRHEVLVSSEEPLWIRVVRPNGGEQLYVEKSASIEWEANSEIDFVSIEMSFDSGATFPYIIAPSTPNDGIALWDPIPVEAAGDTDRIRISAVDNPDVCDESNKDFSVLGDWLHVTSPNGGEEWGAGSSHEITWESSESGGNLFIAYSKDAFESDLNWIVRGTLNDGSYMWEDIPFDISDTVRIAILSTEPFMLGVSENDFSITLPPAFINLLVPNGGEEWGTGSSQLVTWDSAGVTGNVNILFSTDDFGTQVSTVAEDIPNVNQYYWTDTPVVPTDTARVRVESVDNPAICDTSRDYFSFMETGWVRTWGDGLDEEVRTVAVDDDGYIYTGGQEDYDGLNGPAHLRKFNAAGQLLWNLTLGAEHSVSIAHILDIALDGAGGIYVTGFFKGTDVDFDPDPTGQDLHSSDSGGDIFIGKYDVDGDFKWARTWGGVVSGRSDMGYGCAVSSTGVYVAGSFTGTDTDFDPGPGSDLHTASGNYDSFLSKFSDSGDFIWAGTWGGDAGYDYCSGVAVDTSSRVFVTGRFCGTDTDFDPELYLYETRSAVGLYDFFLSWFHDETHRFKGVYVIGAAGSSIGESVVVDPLGNIVVTGDFEGTDVDFDPGTGEDLHTTIGDSDIFLSLFDSTVAWQWTRTWGGTGYDVAATVATSGAGDIFVCGYFMSVGADFDPGPGIEYRSSNGFTDAFWTRFDISGNYIMSRTYGGSEYDWGFGVGAGDTGTVYMGGAFRSAATEFATTGPPCFDESDMHGSAGGKDALLVKCMPDGCW
jgi:hypothetical protein